MMNNETVTGVGRDCAKLTIAKKIKGQFVVRPMAFFPQSSGCQQARTQRQVPQIKTQSTRSKTPGMRKQF